MKDTARWLVLLIVVALASGSIYYKYQDTRPCAQPIPYAIGAVDSRFDITNTALVSDMKVAVAVWNKAAGKSLFVYDPKAALKVNLIYDEREANAKLGNEITLAQDKADSEHVALDAAQAQLIAEQNTYNQTVETINARGGATPSEARSLASQRESLHRLATTINSQVVAYNASVRALNAVVAEFNKTTGRTFTEGEFVRDAKGERINIFEFIGTNQLERVLAHEFGHALGLEHNDDPKSIMYAKNESGNLVPTTSDLSALKALCGP